MPCWPCQLTGRINSISVAVGQPPWSQQSERDHAAMGGAWLWWCRPSVIESLGSTVWKLRFRAPILALSLGA
jgi:hypothetical protein